jgi:very-short-patch-repair endonuclease
MSDLEAMVYKWLTQHRIKFEFQSQLIGLRGVRELGDAIVDFILTENNILLRIMGEYFHAGVNVEARDTIQKERLQALGYVVVDLWTKDLMERLNYTMQQAIKGEQL